MEILFSQAKPPTQLNRRFEVSTCRHVSPPTSIAPKGGLMLNSDLSPAARKGEGYRLQIKPVWCPRAGGSRQTGSPAGHYNHPLSRSSQTLLGPRIS